MSRHRVVAEVSENVFTLPWSPEMMLTFLHVLEEQDNLDKRTTNTFLRDLFSTVSDTSSFSSTKNVVRGTCRTSIHCQG